MKKLKWLAAFLIVATLFGGIFRGKNLCGFFPCCTSISEFIEFYDTIIQSVAKMSILQHKKIQYFVLLFLLFFDKLT